MTVLVAVETAILLVLVVLVAGLLRAYGTVLQRLHRLDADRSGTTSADAPPPWRTVPGVVDLPDPVTAPTGTAGPTGAAVPATGGDRSWQPAVDVVGTGLDTDAVLVRTAGVQTDTVLLFLSSGCTGCATFWRELAGAPAAPLPGQRLVVVTKGPEQENVSLLRDLAAPGLDVVLSSQAWQDYQVPGSPYVVVVDGRVGRVVGEGSGTSFGQVTRLIQQSLADRSGARDGGANGVRKPDADRDREADVDRALLAAGIGPGHPSLYAPAPPPEQQ